jgi:hypothetical protein
LPRIVPIFKIENCCSGSCCFNTTVNPLKHPWKPLYSAYKIYHVSRSVNMLTSVFCMATKASRATIQDNNPMNAFTITINLKYIVFVHGIIVKLFCCACCGDCRSHTLDTITPPILKNN